ncbi:MULTISPECIES: bifunctional helix-turn-helix transcriptional regulator/GNAT family N-acetyltransferase [Sphingomonas]|uniref:Helix-turn-helix domain-containing GNAT family N-acetyltransferase n=1 Tax=Sphingomonas lycopersici TaxID=2951807 RepID=A0AA41ZF42_9SPHN|nr:MULTISPECIES: helix-turn-helix domain-containing GNAT family N-acetyltransferase [Sphingomonas]MCW6529412.1 helix-turn-helix domain-containing GNAT family N-acetyltransferase [Sphingomonas lycopersici]MCW6535734.1 helix-turn-helix domain-containing GNAT family N-acetyltransferase [Sphingomonas lycopersici]OJU19171.1 MAG: MarR family transcriptional regulator [Sphingomonas sp. 66-10]
MLDRPQGDVALLRAFNRLYTNQLGLLDAHLDGSRFTLSEARILYELAHREDPTAADIARTLNMDRAQISRTLKRFADRGLLETRDDPGHGRQQLLSLTPTGRAAFADLDVRAQEAIGALLDRVSARQRQRLIGAASVMMQAFDGGDEPASVTLRGLRPGDLGLVAARQMMLYAEEYGWDQGYEALVSRILADFHDQFDPARDAAWIADIDGEMAGSIFLVHGDDPAVAKLRLLYVESFARGAGVGRLLVETCIAHARRLGYRRLTLWTNSVLAAARHIYERAGFVLVDEAPHHSFGHDLIGQNWSLDL